MSIRLFFFLMIRRPPRSTLFPTRRSSDLDGFVAAFQKASGLTVDYKEDFNDNEQWFAKVKEPRSEEHTSELQSQSNLVCRLLLEKKKSLDHQRRAQTSLQQLLPH